MSRCIRGFRWIAAALAGMALALPGCGMGAGVDPQSVENPNIVIATDKNFDEVIAGGVVLVDFTADWCRYCRDQKPIVDRLAGEYAGRVTVVSINFDANRATAKRFDVEGLPTLIVFKDGEVVPNGQLVGLQQEATLRRLLDRALK